MGSVTVNGKAERSDVCIVLHDLRGGGAEHASLRLAHGMLEAKRNVEIVLVRDEGVYRDEIPAGARVTVLGSRRVAAAIPALARHIRTRRPRAVLSALTHVNLAAIVAARAAGNGTRIVVSERNQISREAGRAGSVRQRATYRAVPWLYPRADAIVAVSQGVARDLENFGALPDGKVHVIHNPVYTDAIERKAALPPDHPWLQDNRIPCVLAAGRLSPQKAFDTLLRAFRAVHQHTRCRLVLLGEGEERAALETLARELGIARDVSMPGFAANPYAFMARAAVFALSSRWEGFPNALVEAMACGAPVVATDCPSGPREILDGGRYGALVPVDDAEAMAASLRDALEFPGDTGTARRRARSFNLATAAARYLEVLEV